MKMIDIEQQSYEETSMLIGGFPKARHFAASFTAISTNYTNQNLTVIANSSILRKTQDQKQAEEPSA